MPKATGLRLEYVSLEELKRWPRNPKDHDLGELHVSMDRFGFTTPFVRDERTGMLAEGHGRLDTLEQKQKLGMPAPKNVRVDNEGKWLVPVVCGNSFESEEELAAFVVAANQLTIRGWWNEGELADVLSSLTEVGDRMLQGTGFDTDYLNNLIAKLNPLPMDKVAGEDGHSVAGGDGFDIVVRVMTTEQRDEFVAYLKDNEFTYEVRLARKAARPS